MPVYLAQAAGPAQWRAQSVRNSSGYGLLSPAILARGFGIENMKAIPPRDISAGEFELPRITGAGPVFAEAPLGPGAVQKAREKGKQEGFATLAQHGYDADPAAHKRWTSAQIRQQVEQKLRVFWAGLGTGQSSGFSHANPVKFLEAQRDEGNCGDPERKP